MYKYAYRDWPWCDPRLEEYMDKYSAIHKKDMHWPKPRQDELFEEWNEKVTKLCDEHWGRVHKDVHLLTEEYSNIISLIKSEGDPSEQVY